MNEDNYLVSIITPSFNSEKYIKDAILSVINQTYQNWELIIIDDCSTDNSLSIVKSFSRNDSRINYYKNKTNSGAAVSRNLGLEKSLGRFVSFIDSDDIWFPEKLDLQINFMLDNDYIISFTSYGLIDNQGNFLNKIIRSVKEIDYKGYMKNTVIGMSTSMIDTSKTDSFKFINIRTRQDTYLWITLLKRGLKAHGINSVLANYRVRNESISSNKLQAAKRVWFLYYSLENLGYFRSLYFFSFYLFNAVKKRFL